MLRRALRHAIAPTPTLTWAEATLVSCLAVAASLPLVAGAYLAKSAAGINLMTGPSPLHDLLFRFVQ